MPPTSVSRIYQFIPFPSRELGETPPSRESGFGISDPSARQRWEYMISGEFERVTEER